jgi:methionyl-tRNA formyltransferase
VADAFRVGFAGTPPFAATALDAIAEAQFDVVLALTRPDAARGRGLKLAPSAVKLRAQHHAIPVLEPRQLKDSSTLRDVCEMSLDVLVVAAYGLILPLPMLTWPRHGCLNIHASLLPRWRGAAPIARAVLAGDELTGVSIMQMDAGLDTGPVVATATVPIAPRETAQTLEVKLAREGAGMIVESLAALRRDGRLAATPQPSDGATYASKISRSEAVIDWRESATATDRRIRAFDPFPGAQTSLEGETLKIWRAEPAPGRFGEPGCVVQADPHGIVVACGEGALIVHELQRAGARRLDASAFLAGHPLAAGSRFGG